MSDSNRIKTVVIDGTTYEVRPRQGRRPKGEPPPAGPRSEELGEVSEAVVRSAPKYGNFLAAGAVVGIILTALLTFAYQPSSDINHFALFTHIGILLIPFPVIIAGGFALWLDYRSRKEALRQPDSE